MKRKEEMKLIQQQQELLESIKKDPRYQDVMKYLDALREVEKAKESKSVENNYTSEFFG